jgi:hypothetical protein
MGQLICAWCGRVLSNNYPIQGISHGICPECERKFREQANRRPVQPDTVQPHGQWPKGKN